MKRIFPTILLILSLIFTGCGLGQEHRNEPDPLLNEYLTHLDFLPKPVREYGEGTAVVQMEGHLMVRIMYPEGEIQPLNEAMESWIQETISYYQEDAATVKEGEDNAELTADYNSYVVNDNWVSVEIRGIYEKPYNAHPEDIVATFHANLATGELVTLDDILLPGGREYLQELVVGAANIDPEVVDEYLLDNWKLTADGIEIILERGAYLPMSSGTTTFLYTYEEMQDVISLENVPGAEDGLTEESSETGEEQVTTDTSEETEQSKLPGTEQAEGNLSQNQTQNISPSTPAEETVKRLALTFDDGPSKYTDRLLDAFATYGGKGTYFVVGNLVDTRVETLKRMVDEGHQVAGHSWDHRQLTKLNRQDLKDQIMNTRAKIYDVTGVDATTMRPPYGSYNDEVKAVCAEVGVVMINWSVDTLDWKTKNADMVYDVIMSEAADGAIILCHDLYGSTVEALERAIPDLLAAGYELVTVSELLSGDGQALEAGKVYNRKIP